MFFPSKKELNNSILKHLNESYRSNDDESFVILNSITLCAISMVIFIRKKYALYLSDIKNDSISTGFGGIMANKGAVYISFKLADRKLLFINTH